MLGDLWGNPGYAGLMVTHGMQILCSPDEMITLGFWGNFCADSQRTFEDSSSPRQVAIGLCGPEEMEAIWENYRNRAVT